MWTLIKSEVKYNAGIILFVFLFNIFFTVSGLARLELFPANSIMGKYFWTILISVGSYFLIFLYWTIRVVEKRDRLITLLPFPQKELRAARYIIGVIPFICIAVWVELNRLILPDDWHIYIDRTSTQLSMLFIFLSLFAIGMEVSSGRQYKSRTNFIIDSVILLNLTAASIAIYTLDAFSYLFSLGVLNGRLYFYLWALIISFAAVRIFYKRTSFTE